MLEHFHYFLTKDQKYVLGKITGRLIDKLVVNCSVFKNKIQALFKHFQDILTENAQTLEALIITSTFLL